MTGTVEQLTPSDAPALRELLITDSVQNLYLLGLLEEFGIAPQAGRPAFAYFGRFEGRVLTATVFVGGGGGLVIPAAGSSSHLTEICSALRGKVSLRSALGPAAGVDVVVRHFCEGKPKLSRAQRLFTVSADDLGPFTNPTLRLATEADLPQLVPMAAGLVKEMYERDPLVEDPDGFKERVRARIRAKRTYVLQVGEQLVFKVDVGSRSHYGAELEGLYTIPEARKHGHATLSLGQISRHLLSSLPRLTLRIDDRDAMFAELARKVGYLAGKSQRLVMNA